MTWHLFKRELEVCACGAYCPNIDAYRRHVIEAEDLGSLTEYYDLTSPEY